MKGVSIGRRGSGTAHVLVGVADRCRDVDHLVEGLGFRVWVLGFGVWGLGLGVLGLGFKVWVWCLGFGVWGLGLRVESSGFRV